MKIDKLIISHSSRSTFASCPRKLEFRKFYGHSRRDESLATLAGSALHAAYQDYLVHGDKERATFILMMELKVAYDVSPLKPRSLEACYATLLAMIDYQGYSDCELAYIDVNGESRPAIEVPFRIRIKDFSLGRDDEPQIPVEYIGFIDMIMYNVVHQQFVATDIKTHMRTLGDMTSAYKFDEQVLPYALILEAIVGKPITNLDVQYMSCYISLDEPQIANYGFNKTQADIQDWTRGLALDLQLMKMYYQTQWFPRRANACTAYNRTCGQFDFCQSRDEKVIETMLSFETPYEARPFEPWIDIELAIEQGNK